GAVVGLIQVQVLVELLPIRRQGQSQFLLYVQARLHDGARGHGLGLFQQLALAGQGQDASLVGRAQGRVLQQGVPGLDQRGRLGRRGRAAGGARQDQAGGQQLGGFPAGEGVRVVARQQGQFRVGAVILDAHWRREI